MTTTVQPDHAKPMSPNQDLVHWRHLSFGRFSYIEYIALNLSRNCTEIVDVFRCIYSKQRWPNTTPYWLLAALRLLICLQRHRQDRRRMPTNVSTHVQSCNSTITDMASNCPSLPYLVSSYACLESLSHCTVTILGLSPALLSRYIWSSITAMSSFRPKLQGISQDAFIRSAFCQSACAKDCIVLIYANRPNSGVGRNTLLPSCQTGHNATCGHCAA